MVRIFQRFGDTFLTLYIDASGSSETLLNLWKITGRETYSVTNDIPKCEAGVYVRIRPEYMCFAETYTPSRAVHN
jgi:hypothetical protein